MNKLGFAIKLASQGASNAIECNEGQWTNKVVDIREYLKLFNGLQNTKNIVTFMSFDEGGCFLTQLRAIPGRVGDFLSGWIYIPNTINASGKEIESAYNYVRNILKQSDLSDLKDDIESFFLKEYPPKEAVAQYSASKGQLYGFRFLDDYYNLKEIVGENRYQPYYSDYKAVFLLNKKEGVEIKKEAEKSFINLTNKDIDKTSILIPPTEASLQELGSGTTIQTDNDIDFNQPLLVNAGSKVTLVLSRSGFENQKFEVNVTQERQDVVLPDVGKTWMKKISASMFTVRNRKLEKIDKDVCILVNGTDITLQETLVSEEDCRKALVKVSAPDFEVFEQYCSLLNGNLDITLSRKVKQAQTVVELSNGSCGKMTIESKHLPSNYDSPLKGYEFNEDDRGNKVLKLSSLFVWKQRLWGFFAALAVVMLIIAYAAFDAWVGTHHFKFGLPPWEEDRPVQAWQQNANNGTEDVEVTDTNAQTNQQILDYLNQNDLWEKVKLDQDPSTKGLYDMINNYRFSDILNVSIENCDKINRVKEISQRMIDAGFSLSGSYSKDGTITIQKWIDAVNAKYEQKYTEHEVSNGEPANQLAVKIDEKKAKKKAAKEAAKEKAPEKAAKKKVAEEDAKEKKNGGL